MTRVKKGDKPVEQLGTREFDPMPAEKLQRRAEAFAIATSTPKEQGGCKADVYGREPKGQPKGKP